MINNQTENRIKKQEKWIAVEIDKQQSGRKNVKTAIDLLDQASERYDLIIPGKNKTIARGIFNTKGNFSILITLLRLVFKWSGTVVYANGRQIDAQKHNQFIKFLECAANNAPCQSLRKDKRLRYISCHLSPYNIGLLDFTIQRLKKNYKFWFSFIKPYKAYLGRYILDKQTLERAVLKAELCPLFPVSNMYLIEKLPLVIDLNDKDDSAAWVPVKYRIRTKWQCRLPLIVPRYDNSYNARVVRILDAEIKYSPPNKFGSSTNKLM